MGLLLQNEARKEIKINKKLGFPYPCRGIRRSKSNVLGEIPINELIQRDYQNLLSSAPDELKKAIAKEREHIDNSKTYYTLRDQYYLSLNCPPELLKKEEVSLIALIFGDFDFLFITCEPLKIKEKLISAAVNKGEPVKRAYKKLKRGTSWKRLKGV